LYLMLGDEADAEQSRGQKFFVYGAIFVPQESIKPLTDGVEAIRTAAKFEPTDSLKFANKTRPPKISKETFREVKAKVMDLAAQHGVVFCAYAILHAIAANRGHKDLVLFGANTLLGKFNEFLGTDQDTFGLVLFDRIPIDHPYAYLREKFQIGMTFLDGRPTSRLERIMGLATTADGASHLASIADILVGSWRYCVNEPEMDVAGKAIFPKLMDLMWKRTRDGQLYVLDFGFVLRPQEVQVEKYKKDYNDLRARLQSYLDARDAASAAKQKRN
jgi:hypothetical protein